MPDIEEEIDSTRASRAGHTFHERWAARRALQLVFPNDDLFAIAVEGISSTETAGPGKRGEEVADLVLYYGSGDNFDGCDRLETIQFKYKLNEEAVTAAYLKKTIEKFADTLHGYEGTFSGADADRKLSFIFVTNTEFTANLWEAIEALKEGTQPPTGGATTQARNLEKWCKSRGLTDASRLFSRTVFRAREKSLAGQDNALKRTFTDWSAGADPEARNRLHGLQDLVLKKAGPSGQGKNLIRREDVLDALDCEPEDLFPAESRFIKVGTVVDRAELLMVSDLLKTSNSPVFVHAEGGVGKTIFVQSLASRMADDFEVVVFDCFGGGSYRSDSQSRHLPKIGLVQIVNELAFRTLCDPLLPGSDDNQKVVRATRKRLGQAAAAIKAQSKKHGLLLIVDAVDNAQVEADYRHEAAFPKMLLSSLSEVPIEGVKLLFTARTHRKNDVICSSTVAEFALGPFTNAEALEFLKDRVPTASDVEVATALTRSGRNARVLDYLVSTWDVNVVGKFLADPITVPEIIAQRCRKIVSDLRIVGWQDSEVVEFFVALSLLPPPIPLDELANALGWSATQVNSAASDLAPMLEITLQGAIFRDEPTETYVRETYSNHVAAQRTIADRLLSSQATSTYAAEALPHFLVVVKDINRAFALADSSAFPKTIQSDFGRRRLTLARLRAAFRLAVAAHDFDRVQGLTVRLAQVATANMRGDEFIRKAPALAVVFGDADSYRRLFADRAGWRGARSARLTIAHNFASDTGEAQIQCASTKRWINWYNERPKDEMDGDREGHNVHDFVAVLFHEVVRSEFGIVDRNLAKWNDEFSMSVSYNLLKLLELFDQTNSTKKYEALVAFVASEKCTSKALKLQVLSCVQSISNKQVKILAKQVGSPSCSNFDQREDYSARPIREKSGEIEHAVLTTLLFGSRTAAFTLVRNAKDSRPSAYDYGERYGPSKIWPHVFRTAVRAWSAGRRVAYHDLLPSQVKITKKAKALATKSQLLKFLEELQEARANNSDKKIRKKQLKAQFNTQEREQVSNAIELVQKLISPVEKAVFSTSGFSKTTLNDFLTLWSGSLRSDIHWKAETASDQLVRSIGIGCLHLFLKHLPSISVDQAKTIVGLISSERFFIEQKIDVLGQLAKRTVLHQVVGEFAQHVSEHILRDDYIEQRGNYYLELANSLAPMSINEAREYYRRGLAQLDQLGGESYDQIYSLLHFASAQKGGLLKPILAQRLMNLCQMIASNEPGKFGWTLFGRAAASSVGLPAIAKIIRWHDQDVAEMSYGLPQLVCFLASGKKLDPRRAAILLMICKDHGWHEWKCGDGVVDLLRNANLSDQRPISSSIIKKIKSEHMFGGWPALWESLLNVGNIYPNSISVDERNELELLKTDAELERDRVNSRNEVHPDLRIGTPPKQTDEEVSNLIAGLVASCDHTSPLSVDKALKGVEAGVKFDYRVKERFIAELCQSCPYAQRLNYLFSICETVELNLVQSIEILKNCLASWTSSTLHLASQTKSIIEKLFASKGTEIFDGQFSSLSRDIRRMSEFCGDKSFVILLVLDRVVTDTIELDGDEWLQLATALCDVAAPLAGLEALELILSGPTSRIADEVGEGPFDSRNEIANDETEFFADLFWHLLGNSDAYVRWTTARALNLLVEFGLIDDLSLILDRFDKQKVGGFLSKDCPLSFQNSQQWLLMGISRSALLHGKVLLPLRPKLISLAERTDLHLLHKLHLARSLRNMDRSAVINPDVKAIFDDINLPPKGTVIGNGYPAQLESITEFQFDYEFAKTEISTLARLFNIAQARVEDAIAAEIIQRWPEASSLDFFKGSERYRWDRDNQHELYREHIQKHALLNAATSLSKVMPITVRSYETQGPSPWLEWRNRYDITFDDGSWLSDWKDEVPQQAKESLLGEQTGQQQTLQDQETILSKIGILSTPLGKEFPLYGRWTSRDGVSVSITAALIQRKGSVGQCIALAKQNDHNLWLPECWDEGYYDPNHRQQSQFMPLVWSPESYGIGVDLGDEIATQGPAERPRLGIELTQTFKLESVNNGREWRKSDGSQVLRAQVWGEWRPSPDSRGARFNDSGEVLWASADWLTETLASLKMQIVFKVSLRKYRSSHSYDPSSGVKSVIVGLRNEDGTVRVWHAKKASKQND
jgi:NACHT domain